MNEEKKPISDYAKKDAATVFMRITSHQPLDQLCNIDRAWIEEMIAEALQVQRDLAKAWENNYWALKKERDEYLKSLKDIRQGMEDCGFDETVKDINKLIHKYNPL